MATTPSAFNPQTDSCCGRIVAAIDMVNDPTSRTPSTGLREALLSDQNDVGIEIMTPPTTNGYTATSFREIITKAIKPNCTTGSIAEAICDMPATIGNSDSNMYITSKHTIDESIQRKIVINYTDFDKFCDSPEDYLAKKLQQFKAGVHKEINDKILTKVLAYMGAYHYQTTPDTSVSMPESVSLFAPNAFQGGSAIDNNGLARIGNLYGFLDYMGVEPIIVGGIHVGHLAQLQIQQAMSNIFFDSTIDATIADGLSHLLTWAPGTLMLKSVLETTPALMKSNIVGQREYSTVASPFGDGLEWDYRAVYNASGCALEIRLQAHFDVICPVPYDLTCTKKPALHFLTDCTPMDCAKISYQG